jgi:tRNA (guanine-N7-)-methyltransferase
MSKKKLQRFAEMDTFTNVLQPRFDEVFGKDHERKGNWKHGYFGNDNPLILELGCGKGEYTLELANRHAEKNYVGVDIKGARIWKGARRAFHDGMKNVAFVRSRIELISSFFGHSEVDEIWLTFPDPQLKKERKRLTSPRFLNLYRMFLRHNGCIHLKTDSAMLYQYTLDVVTFNGCRILSHTNDLYHSGNQDEILAIRTFYEQQFLDQGMKIHYLCFELSSEKDILEPEAI